MTDKKRMCSGCRNSFYNGNNPYGLTECWLFKQAKIVSRIPIGVWEDPPYKNKEKIKVLNCWHGEGSGGTIYVEPDRIDTQGYWR